MDASCSGTAVDGNGGREADPVIGSEETYRGDSASSRGGADGAGRLSKGLAEHIKGGTGRCWR